MQLGLQGLVALLQGLVAQLQRLGHAVKALAHAHKLSADTRSRGCHARLQPTLLDLPMRRKQFLRRLDNGTPADVPRQRAAEQADQQQRDELLGQREPLGGQHTVAVDADDDEKVRCLALSA